MSSNRDEARRIARFLGSLPVLFVFGLLLSCAARTAQFRPAGAAGEADVLGQSAAYYELVRGEKNWGDVKVWSQGGGPEERDGIEPVLHAGLRIRNDSQEPIELLLDRVSVELNTTERVLTVIDDAQKLSGDANVSPESVQRFEFHFPLPAGLKAGDVRGFEFNWAVQTPEGVYTQSTPFTRVRSGYDRYWRPAYKFSYWHHPFYHSPGGHHWYYRSYGY